MGDRAIYLTVEEIWRLAHAVRPVEDAFGGQPVYLVGSVLKSSDWRDVDLRVILPDHDFDRIFEPPGELTDQFRMLFQTAVSAMLRETTKLPIDFQVQRKSNLTQEESFGERNPAGKARSYVGTDFIPQWMR